MFPHMFIIKPNSNRKEVTLSKVKVISYAYIHPSLPALIQQIFIEIIKACHSIEAMWEIYK